MDYEAAAIAVVGAVGVGFLLFLTKWAWTHTHKRIDDATTYVGKAVDDLYKSIEKKADNYELERARDAQKDIFTKIEKHDSEDRERHTQIMLQIGELKGMMGTLLSRRRDSKDQL